MRSDAHGANLCSRRCSDLCSDSLKVEKGRMSLERTQGPSVRDRVGEQGGSDVAAAGDPVQDLLMIERTGEDRSGRLGGGV